MHDTHAKADRKPDAHARASDTRDKRMHERRTARVQQRLERNNGDARRPPWGKTAAEENLTRSLRINGRNGLWVDYSYCPR